MNRLYEAAVALVAVPIVALLAAMLAVVPAQAGKQKQYVYSWGGSSTSLDGRNTGRARTCGYEGFQYDSRGVPRGPYCH
jgi:hypothetical protein